MKKSKLIYDFNTAMCLEGYIPSLQQWVRMTANEFRSFDGLRRMTGPTHTKLGEVNIPVESTLYDGPVYEHGTNIKKKKKL